VAGEILTSLEMTAPSQLVAGRTPPAAVELEEVGPDSASLVGSIYVRIGAPHGWTGRTTWSDEQWEGELSRPDARTWIARVDEVVAGFVELEMNPTGDAGIVVFGLVPEFVGRGFGGEFLTIATRLAWQLRAPDGSPPTRVWVQTSSRDHPNAQRNYERRGFRAFRRDRKQTETAR
jgi:GNAT superfamily N-acetyltransferase